MSFPPPNPNDYQNLDEFAQQLGDDLFAPPPYQTNPNYPPPLYPQNQNFQPPIYSQTSNYSSGAHCSSSSVPEINMTPSSGDATPNSTVPPASEMESEATEKRKRSGPTYNAPWWRYYEKTFDEKGFVTFARCKVKGCTAGYKYVQKNGNSTLSKHAKKHESEHQEPQNEPDPRMVQTLLNSDGTRTHRKYDPEKMLSEFTRYIAHKEQPLSMANCMSFARLIICGVGEPLYRRFHHRKITKELKKQFVERRNQLVAQFALATYKVSITSDIWTAGKHGLGYSCITAHYIDDNWILQKRILSFRVLDSPHTAKVIYDSIMGVLKEYNLVRDLGNKVFSISFDNASNNIKSIDYFLRSLNPIMDGNMLHQKCACHILNLTVKAGLETKGVDNLITKFKNAVTHIYSNQVRKQNFHQLCHRVGLSKLAVPWDIDTRWNSTYRMFHRVLPYKDAIDTMLKSNSESMQLMLSPGEWEQLKHVKEFLKAFFEATVKLSCSYTPSAHELLQHLFVISKVYHDIRELESQDETLAPIVEAMTTKFLKYWDEVPYVTIIANCLNPSWKPKYTVKLLQRYKANLGLPTHNEETRVNFALETMFNLYNSRINVAEPISIRSSAGSSSNQGLLDELRDEDDFDENSSTDELKSYSLGKVESKEVDILDYWKRNSSNFPTLAMMARDIFAVPVSTVPSESCFSSANRILTDRRSKLGPNVFERLVCMKDWIDAENRSQHFVPAETSSGVDTQESGTTTEVESEDEYDPKDTELWYLRKNY